MGKEAAEGVVLVSKLYCACFSCESRSLRVLDI
jgi:hypothetical protein